MSIQIGILQASKLVSLTQIINHTLNGITVYFLYSKSVFIMPIKKWFTSVKTVAKKPIVTVQTKKMSEGECCMSDKKISGGDCCAPKKHCCGKMFMMLLLIANVVLTWLVLTQQRNVESMRVGGTENYKMLQQVFKSEGFKAQQQQQIQQAMQMYKVQGTEVATDETLPVVK